MSKSNAEGIWNHQFRCLEDPKSGLVTTHWIGSEIYQISIVELFQLLRIEEELGAEAVYAGANYRNPVEPY